MTTRDHPRSKPHGPKPAGVGGPWNLKNHWISPSLESNWTVSILWTSMLSNTGPFTLTQDRPLSQIFRSAFIQKVAISPAVFLACHQIERLHQLIQITPIRDGPMTHRPIRNRIQRFQIKNHFKNHSKLLYSKKLMPSKLASMNKV